MGESKLSDAINALNLNMIVVEEMHRDEVNKMLRRPGDTAAFKA